MFSVRRLQRAFPLQQVCFWIAGACAGVLLSAYATTALNQQVWMFVTGTLMVVMFVLGVVIEVMQRQEIAVAIESPITITSPQEALEYARTGYIGFVPLYRPQPLGRGHQLTPTQRLQAAERCDLDSLDLEHSNIWPTILAITTHASKLRHVWLLPTGGADAAASLPYTQVLIAYLRPLLHADCRFYADASYLISMERDSEVLTKTYKRVKAVLRQAEALPLSRRELVADITTGVRSMTLGMVLACLDKDHDIQFVGTHYDIDGQPKPQDSAPIIFSFEPHL